MTSDYQVCSQNFHHLFLQDTPFLDVRAEDEFEKGSFPFSANHPILNNKERHLVGTCYKKEGQQAAIKLGHKLVSGTTKTDRISKWCEVATKNPNTHLHCWRGGMRSKLAQQWMNDSGVKVPIIIGGYKALRRYLIEVIDQTLEQTPLIRIGGKTGVAKTPLINEIPNSVDLEKHANHRGSSFGRKVSSQPTQSNFEHALAIDFLRKTHNTSNKKMLFVEDEGKCIGSVGLPLILSDTMRRAPLAIIDMPLEFRAQRVLQEYVIDMLNDFSQVNAEAGFENLSQYLNDSLFRIRKRLGLERYQHTAQLLAHALQTQKSTNNSQEHIAWITVLLTEYYDPMYAYQLQKNQTSIIFRGNYSEVLEWAHQLTTAK